MTTDPYIDTPPPEPEDGPQDPVAWDDLEEEQHPHG